MEFSKKIFIVIFIFWIISLITTGVVKVIFDVDLDFVMSYINTAFVSNLAVYGIKAGAENVMKIKSNETN